MRSHHKPPQGDTPGWATHTSRECRFDVEAVEDHAPYVPELWRLALTRCLTCDRAILPGDTHFRPAHHCVQGFTLCWECGTALMLFLGYYDQADIDRIPPIGGPTRHGPHADVRN